MKTTLQKHLGQFVQVSPKLFQDPRNRRLFWRSQPFHYGLVSKEGKNLHATRCGRRFLGETGPNKTSGSIAWRCLSSLAELRDRR